MRLTEALLFLPLAAGLHVGVWTVAPMSMGASATGGPGQDQVTLAAATAQHVAMAQRWQTPPQTARVPNQPVPAVARPDLPKFSAAHAGPTLPPIPLLRPVLPAALPRTEPPPPPATQPVAVAKPPAQPPVQPQTGMPPPLRTPQEQADRTVQKNQPSRPASPRPDALALADTALPPAPPAPKPPRKPKATQTKPPSAPASPQRASGGGKTTKPQSGRSGKDATQSANAATRNALRASWGAKIQRKVLRRLVYPRGATGSGVARVALTIDRGGQLTRLRLAKSSGVEAFDQAALNAVRRTGRFPKAPGALTEATYTFSMSLTFKP